MQRWPQTQANKYGMVGKMLARDVFVRNILSPARMSLPPIPAPAGAPALRMIPPPSLLGEAAPLSVQQGLLLANVASFVGGIFVLNNQWIQMFWGMSLAVLWFLLGGHRDVLTGLKEDRWMQAGLGLGLYMLLRSTFVESFEATPAAMWEGWGNALLLLGFLLTLWLAGRLPNPLHTLGKPVVAMAAVAAGVSLVVYYTVHPEGVFGARLRNWFVYGGWNSVNSGLTFALAACWATVGWRTAEARASRRRWLLAVVLLDAATLLTLSRGAALALVAGHVAFFLAAGWKKAWKPMALMVGMLVAFQISAPIISYIAAKDASKRLGIANEKVAVERYGDQVVSPNPLQTAMERSDNGRFLIYGAAVNCMTTQQDWLVGKGMWAHDDCWSCGLHWYPEHLHGVFWDTFVHGGLPALLALLGFVGWGLSRVWWLARHGEPGWMMLAGSGLAGLLFDGDSIWVLVSIARYEPLLFWTPLVLASSRYLQLVRTGVAADRQKQA